MWQSSDGGRHEIAVRHLDGSLVLKVPEPALAADQRAPIHRTRRRNTHLQHAEPAAVLNAGGDSRPLDLQGVHEGRLIEWKVSFADGFKSDEVTDAQPRGGCRFEGE